MFAFKTAAKQKDKKRKQKRNQSVFAREQAFDLIKNSSVVDPNILETEVFKIIQDE